MAGRLRGAVSGSLADVDRMLGETGARSTATPKTCARRYQAAIEDSINRFAGATDEIRRTAGENPPRVGPTPAPNSSAAPSTCRKKPRKTPRRCAAPWPSRSARAAGTHGHHRRLRSHFETAAPVSSGTRAAHRAATRLSGAARRAAAGGLSATAAARVEAQPVAYQAPRARRQPPWRSNRPP